MLSILCIAWCFIADGLRELGAGGGTMDTAKAVPAPVAVPLAAGPRLGLSWKSMAVIIKPHETPAAMVMPTSAVHHV